MFSWRIRFTFLYSSTFSWWIWFPCNKGGWNLAVNSIRNENEISSYCFQRWPFDLILLFHPLKFGPTKVNSYVKYHACALFSSIGILENELCILEVAFKPFSYEHPEDSFPIGSPDSANLWCSNQKVLHPSFACYVDRHCLSLQIFILNVSNSLWGTLVIFERPYLSTITLLVLLINAMHWALMILRVTLRSYSCVLIDGF